MGERGIEILLRIIGGMVIIGLLILASKCDDEIRKDRVNYRDKEIHMLFEDSKINKLNDNRYIIVKDNGDILEVTYGINNSEGMVTKKIN